METDNINRTHEPAILKVIKDKKIMRFDHIFGHYSGCSRRTGYEHRLHESHDIKEALESNRNKGVDYLLQKWISGSNATLQIAAMRLICTKEEHQLLNQSYIDHTTKGEKVTQRPAIIVADQTTKDELDKLLNETDNTD